MRTTVDIPDEIYQRLKVRAVAESGSVKQLLLRGVEAVLKESTAKLPVTSPRLSKPPVQGGIPGSLRLSNEEIDDLLHAS